MADPPTDATVLGNFVHDVLEALLRLPGTERTTAAAQTLMRDLWEREYRTKAEDVLAVKISASRLVAAMHEFRWKAWWCVENYFAMENPVSVAFDGLEDYVVGDIDGVPMRGYIDRWHHTDDGIVIGDYKTGKTPKPQWQADKFQQLAIYAHLLGAIQQTDVAGMELLYLKDGVRLARPVEQETLNTVAKSVRTVHVELLTACDTGHFETKKSRLCDWCAYKPFCPAWV